jgi:uncharacterized protein (DUF4415 family)
MPRKLDLPSPEEDDAIQRGIEQDPDNPELGDNFFKNARPASAVLLRDVYADLAASKHDRPGAAATVQVMLPVDQDVFEKLRASGPDWQARVDEALRRLAGR